MVEGGARRTRALPMPLLPPMMRTVCSAIFPPRFALSETEEKDQQYSASLGLCKGCGRHLAGK